MEHPLLLSAPRPAQQASRRYRRLRHPRTCNPRQFMSAT